MVSSQDHAAQPAHTSVCRRYRAGGPALPDVVALYRPARRRYLRTCLLQAGGRHHPILHLVPLLRSHLRVLGAGGVRCLLSESGTPARSVRQLLQRPAGAAPLPASPGRSFPAARPIAPCDGPLAKSAPRPATRIRGIHFGRRQDRPPRPRRSGRKPAPAHPVASVAFAGIPVGRRNLCSRRTRTRVDQRVSAPHAPPFHRRASRFRQGEECRPHRAPLQWQSHARRNRRRAGECSGRGILSPRAGRSRCSRST